MKKHFVSLMIVFFLVPNEQFSQSIQIDGVFDEPIWQNATSFHEFKQLAPDIGADASEQTEVFIINDSLYLYFKVICYDSQPDQLRVNLSKRDNIKNDDTFTIEFESNGNTNSNSFFRCNPLGIQEDGTIGRGDYEDLNPDKIWLSKGLVTDQGYQLEIAIPFQSLRYKWSEEISFNVGFCRKIFRKSERVVFPEYDPSISNRLMQRQEIRCKNVQKQRLFEIIPEATYTFDNEKLDQGWVVQQNKPSFGITGKIGIKTDLILDLTYNPDFSQIESDAAKVDVNLRNALFFPEKRPFFQEGQEQYDFGGLLWGTSFQYLVHTRNIIEPLYGVKLTGNLSPKYTIASIFSSDKYNPQMEHYQVMRLRRRLHDDSFVAATYTGKEGKEHANRVAGLDGLIRLNGNSKVEYNFFTSQTVDSGNIKSGNNFALSYEWTNKTYKFKTGYYFTGNDFNTEVGYVTRQGIESLVFLVNGQYPLKNNKLRKIAFWANIKPQRDRQSMMHEFWAYTGFELYFNNDSWLWIGRITASETYTGQKFRKSSWASGYYLQINKILYLEGHLNYGEKIYYDPESPYQGYGWDTDLSLQATPTEQLTLKASGVYSNFIREEDNSFVYDYIVGRFQTNYQVNKYLFLRGIAEYNLYKNSLGGQFLCSYVYRPGTSVQFGYNINAVNNIPGEFRNMARNIELNRSTLFVKLSYLFRR